MDFRILERELELAHADSPLGEKLARACELVLSSTPFDQCAIYLKAEDSDELTLGGAAGDEGARVEEYGGGEGLAGVAVESLAIVRACGTGGGKGLELHGAGVDGQAIDDPGLEGYVCSMAMPLVQGGVTYGSLVMKCRERFRLDEDADAFLRVSAMELASIIRCATMMEASRRDHDKLKEIQDKLLGAEKLMALGDMAAILAHEVKNPIISLGGYISKIKKSVHGDDECMIYVDHMLGEIQRVEKIMNGVIRFLRDNAVELELGDVNALLDEALDVFRYELEEHGIKVVRDYYEEPLPVLADAEQLKIAFDNIISNAIQSMAKHSGGMGGTLRAVTSRTEDSVVIHISDTGGGVDPDVLGYIFNPFFTTKKRGTGLGLAITNSIVMRHKGCIGVENDAGVGVTFTIRLPYVESKEAS